MYKKYFYKKLVYQFGRIIIAPYVCKIDSTKFLFMHYVFIKFQPMLPA